MRQILFDFDKDSVSVFDALDGILFSSGRQSLSIDPEYAGETRLLFTLLQRGAVKIYECDCLYKTKFPKDFQREAHKIANILQKRSVTNPLYNALHMLSDYEPDLQRTLGNALYYPELRAYLRCGDLSPEKLFALLGAGECDRIILFHDTAPAETPPLPNMEPYYVIQSDIPGEKIAECLREAKTESLINAVRATEKSQE